MRTLNELQRDIEWYLGFYLESKANRLKVLIQENNQLHWYNCMFGTNDLLYVYKVMIENKYE